MQLRRAVPGDEPSVAEVHVRSWQVAYRGLLPDAYLDALRPAERARCYTFSAEEQEAPETLVALGDDETVCGFATHGRSRDAGMERAGELYALYVHPDWWGRGAGRSLIGEARARMRERGSSEATLWVLDGNERAQRFYRLDGWDATGETRRAEVHGLVVDELRYRRPLL